jgi:hypothetical protein
MVTDGYLDYEYAKIGSKLMCTEWASYSDTSEEPDEELTVERVIPYQPGLPSSEKTLLLTLCLFICYNSKAREGVFQYISETGTLRDIWRRSSGG